MSPLLARESGLDHQHYAEERLGVSRRTFVRWRAGIVPEGIRALLVIADSHDVSLDWLAGRSNERVSAGGAAERATR